MNIVVIIPAYLPNDLTKQLYERCINSVDNQFIKIVVDDTITHKGVGNARNRGLDEAFKYDPDYITFLDADDEFAKDAYSQILMATREASSAPMIQLNHKRVFSNGKPTILREPNKQGVYKLNGLPTLWMSVVNKVFKADFIRDMRFDTTIDHGEDEIFVLECLCKCRTLYCSERVAMLHHKDNPNSLSTTPSLDSLLGEQRALLDFLEKHQDDKQICEAIKIRQANLWRDNPTYKKVFEKLPSYNNR